MDFDKILDILRENSQAKRFKEINICEAVNYVLAENIFSSINVPEERTSMRDGYALFISPDKDNYKYILYNYCYAGDKKQKLELDLELELKLSKNNLCSYIATGGIVPETANCVVMIENTKKYTNSDEIVITNHEELKENQWIRNIGSDIALNSLVLSKNTLINEACIATLASIGINKIKVFDKVKIGILSSGDELIDIDNANASLKERHLVYDSNRPMLVSYIKNMDLECIDYGILRDNYESTREKITTILDEVDVLITSGGISMGEKDYIKPVVKEIGDVIIEKTNMKPGKPFLFSVIKNHKYIFSLPGNPVSAGVTFLLFVKPFIQALCGEKFKLPAKISAVIRNDLSADKTRLEFIRGRLYSSTKYSKLFVDLTTNNHNSSNISSMNSANCLIEVKANNDLKKGDYVNAYVIGHVEQCDEILNIGILTASDRASAGIYDDKSGEEIRKYITNNVTSKFNIYYFLIPDEIHLIIDALKRMADNLCCNLILTTGGTGPALRDVTDIATREVCHKLLPGFGEIMRSINFKHIPTSILSAQSTGIRYIHKDIGSLIINLPGKPDAIKECLDIIFKSIPKCLQICNADEFTIHH